MEQVSIASSLVTCSCFHRAVGLFTGCVLGGAIWWMPTGL